jgi:hypothetical protein
MKRSKEPDVPTEELRQHSVKLTRDQETRVLKCMKLDGINSFADFARSALLRKCREIEKEHGVS